MISKLEISKLVEENLSQEELELLKETVYLLAYAAFESWKKQKN